MTKSPFLSIPRLSFVNYLVPEGCVLCPPCRSRYQPGTHKHHYLTCWGIRSAGTHHPPLPAGGALRLFSATQMQSALEREKITLQNGPHIQRFEIWHQKQSRKSRLIEQIEGFCNLAHYQKSWGAQRDALESVPTTVELCHMSSEINKTWSNGEKNMWPNHRSCDTPDLEGLTNQTEKSMSKNSCYH